MLASLPPSSEKVDSLVFPSSNQWGVPDLLASHQAEYFTIPFIAWGSCSRRREQAGATIHFYVDDYRFSRLWAEPDTVVGTGCYAVIEPNYTTSLDSPRAWALYSVFQRRWLARYWQSKGLRIYVDLNIPVEFKEFALLGVPKGWKAYATRGYCDRLEALELEYELALEHGGEDILFLVYGGGKKVKEACRSMGLQWAADEMDRVKGKFHG